MSNENFGLPEKLLKSLREIFSTNKKIERVLIYGSRAKGNYSAGSDIDLVIIAPEMEFSEYVRLYSILEEIEVPYKMDITKYELLDENIKEHIREVGKEIYNRYGKLD